MREIENVRDRETGGERGSSLIEVMVAMVVLARALVGVEVRDNGRCHADDEDQRHNQDHRIPERVQVT